ncbi:DDE-type integrase/transposase/recombinase [Aromatoleum toluclasticum]|uniref:DDE-type integrase/transposase/recombinase n=1 Tax=Aromatoleum toluclasticum TaxID=92003 RepID=UPI001D1973AB|nr:DDE-type integrase/transposase/recombinase [Aromatoleum toluclasticum]MCC4116386.1 DDE-type integrase/transposase/recombinase [Aromatoleum toluclasticum]
MTRKTHYSCAELAALRLPGYPGSEMGWSKLVKREAYVFQDVPAKGGKNGVRREYAPPAAVAKLIDRAEGIVAAGDRAARVSAVIEQFDRDDAEREANRQAKGEAALAMLAEGMTAGQHSRFDGRLAIVQGWEVWFVQAQPMRKKAGLHTFAALYNEDRLPPLPMITAAVREAFPTISYRSVERWHGDYVLNGLAGLIDKQDGKLLKDVNVFTKQPALYNAALALIVARPTIKITDLVEMLREAAVDGETGEILFEVPSADASYRFVNNWKKKHPELYLAATNPDEWKNRCMSAVGNASEDVVRLNQRWEMDATPADWMLTDPESGQRRRYTCSVVIDVYSRRMLVVLSRTPKAQTHMFCLRLALLAWGVPEVIVTDNGQDYKANEFRMALEALGIEQRVTAPFSPWQKPHVERGIGVMLHSILELLPNFVGHNVAERSAIESRRAFSERLFQKDSVIELDMRPTELQGLINDWLAGTYEQRPHGETNEAPFARAAAWTGTVRRIDDERALDVLLLPLTGSRTLQKKGLQIDGGWYAAPELFRLVEVGTEVTVRETEDFGTVVVHQEAKFICAAICPERKGVSRKELASHVRNAQAKRVKEDKKRLRLASKIDPDRMVGELLRKKAAAAGKLAAMPSRETVAHQSEGLDQAARAAKRLDGGREAAPLSPETSRALAAKQAERAMPAAAAAVQPRVIQIPETPELRFRKWLEINETAERGEVIDDAKLQKWWGLYQQSSEFGALMRRHKAALNNTGTTVAAVMPVRTANGN